MAKNTPSSIDRLPEPVRELIGSLRREGRTIDEILAKLGELSIDVSRSALGRHVRTLADLSERMRRTTAATEAIARMGGQQDKLLEGTMEWLKSLLLEASLAQEEGEDGEWRPVTFNPLQVKALAQTAEALARAEKITVDREAKIEERAAKKAVALAAQKAGAAGKAKGLGQETVDFIVAAVLGDGAPA